MHFSTIAFAVFAAAAAASPTTTSRHVLHEKREVSFRGWTKRDALPSRAVLPFRIGLQQSNLDKGYDMLMETSDMSSPKYGQHYTAEEVIEIFKPSQEAVDTVRNWLEGAGIASDRIGHSVNKQWIMFDATAAEAEDLFKTKYYEYEHSGSGRTNIGCDEWVSLSHV